jgi:DNA helicase IV
MSSPVIGEEQQHLTTLYARLDAERDRAAARLADTLREVGTNKQGLNHRDALANRYAQDVARFDAVEHGLCFGRVDRVDGTHHHIGRIGLRDGTAEHHTLLVDWRAPAARPFYLATAASPEGVTLRRHIRTDNRVVIDVEDDVLDLVEAAGGSHDGSLTSESVLLAALNAHRTGRMRDIVETIQVEQDAVIRSDLAGVLVVQGGPGTGKTAVALHRAAYLLYTHRERLASRGVLVVGPNDTFLRYIAHVLPSLAETGVLLWTVGDLFPGVQGRRDESPAAARIKGRAVMVEVIGNAIRDRQRVPDEPWVINDDVVLDRPAVAAARHRARATGLLHNLAKPYFDDALLDELTEREAARVGADPFTGSNLLARGDVAEIRRELAEDPTIRFALDELWPVLTPQRLLADLFADPDLLDSAAPMLTPAERTLLYRLPEGGFSAADAPLLDEAAELLGEDDRAARAEAARVRRERLAWAQGVLDLTEGSRSTDAEDNWDDVLSASDIVTAELLAGRHEERDPRSTAEKAAADRRWAFGHVIVDEAQELSAMAWRALMRRCQSRSMTIVGDLAQTGDPAGARSWGEVLSPFVAERWRAAELTVSYRTPAEIMAVAARILARIDPTLPAPRAVRATGVAPRLVTIDEVSAVLTEELSRPGTVALITSGERPEPRPGLSVLGVHEAKGLEFDAVLVVDPDAIVAASPRGLSDLYVALTRPTQRLTVAVPAGAPAPWWWTAA